MGDLHLSYCLRYLDYIAIYRKTYEEHLVRQSGSADFQKLQDAGLKQFSTNCTKEIKYLGHMISEESISVAPNKTSEIYRVSPAYLHIKRCCVT